MIDLHLHTTASDGRSSPEQLVHAARLAGLRVLAVTDHDGFYGIVKAHGGTIQVESVVGAGSTRGPRSRYLPGSQRSQRLPASPERPEIRRPLVQDFGPGSLTYGRCSQDAIAQRENNAGRGAHVNVIIQNSQGRVSVDYASWKWIEMNNAGASFPEAKPDSA